jgi:hypothetical protein
MIAILLVKNYMARDIQLYHTENLSSFNITLELKTITCHGIKANQPSNRGREWDRPMTYLNQRRHC